MRDNRDAQRNYSRDSLDLPTTWGIAAQVNHHDDAKKHCYEKVFERAEDLGYFLEKIRILLFFVRGSPLHVNSKHVSKNGQAQMEGEASEKYGEHGHPLEILENRGQYVLLAHAVADDCEGYVAEKVEHYYEGQKHYEAKVSSNNIAVILYEIILTLP